MLCLQEHTNVERNLINGCKRPRNYLKSQSFLVTIHCMYACLYAKINRSKHVTVYLNNSFISCLLISTLNHQNNPKQTPLLHNCCVCPSFGLRRGVKMCYCTRVFWPKVQPHCSCHEQNAELSDCWQTAAVTGCCFLTHGWHRAPTGGPLWASPWAQMWSGHRRHPCTIPFSVRVTCCRRERRQGETSSHWWESTGPPQRRGHHGPLWPFDTRLTPTDLEAKCCTANGDFLVTADRRRGRHLQTGVGMMKERRWWFFFFPIQGQTACVRHSPSGSVSVCRRNFNLADRRHTGTVRSFFSSLCSHLHLHLILSDYDSWSFAFKHKNTPLSLTLHSLLSTYSLKIAGNHGKDSYGNILLKSKNLMAVIKDLFH